MPGAIVLFGSGETAAVGREALRWLAGTGRVTRSVAVLETPAGFELNADAVAGRWTRFLRRQPELRGAEFSQLAARRRGTPESPDEPSVVDPLLAADLIVLGAGSPTYAVRQLRSSLAWRHATSAHLLGASFLLASAAAIAAGTCALPVYEIYKVGDELDWNAGLGLFDLYGLRLALVTHWDNTDGGPELDTSHAFMGASRFEALLDLLPAGVVVVGIDEHTAIGVDPATATAQVMGRGEMTVIRDRVPTSFGGGSSIPLRELGPFSVRDTDGLVHAETARAIRAARAERAPSPPEEVVALVRTRERARVSKDWDRADRLREEIVERGWTVEDAPGGPRVLPARRTPR